MWIRDSPELTGLPVAQAGQFRVGAALDLAHRAVREEGVEPVSYTHLGAHETPEHLVCRLLLEKKKTLQKNNKSQKKTENNSTHATSSECTYIKKTIT